MLRLEMERDLKKGILVLLRGLGEVTGESEPLWSVPPPWDARRSADRAVYLDHFLTAL